ncbi:MAG TPA: DNA oxidative demethylase AlkB [Cellvibrio sp.]|nr:DNA oxidative demethylase AlkB [Cellvibrio sp.]
MTPDLFSRESTQWCEQICEGAVVLRGFALDRDSLLLAEIARIVAAAPWRKMVTPGGLPMSVATTSCGTVGWVSDVYGYRYSPRDARSQAQWPALPLSFLELAQAAAAKAGYEHFLPDSCLINCYGIAAKMSLHQDRNEKDFTQPIVSVSLGLPATFLWGGMQRGDKALRIPLVHGDVVVWGGPARLRFHGVQPVKAGVHSLLGEQRINLTFRKAL